MWCLCGILVLAGWISATTGQDCATSCNSVVDTYLGDIGAGNINGACQHVTPGYVFSWHGSANLVPIAGTYIGCGGLQTFFSKVNQVVKDFTFYQPFAPSTYGIRTLGASCGTVIKQWEEVVYAAVVHGVTVVI